MCSRMVCGNRASSVPEAAISSRVSRVALASRASQIRSHSAFTLFFSCHMNRTSLLPATTRSSLAAFPPRILDDPPARAKKSHLHGVRVQSERIGNLFHGKSLYLFQNQHGAVPVVQLRQHVIEPLPHGHALTGVRTAVRP